MDAELQALKAKLQHAGFNHAQEAAIASNKAKSAIEDLDDAYDAFNLLTSEAYKDRPLDRQILTRIVFKRIKSAQKELASLVIK